MTFTTDTPQITRADLMRVFGGDLRMVRSFEKLLTDIRTNIPDAITQASDIATAPFVLYSPSALTPNAKVLTNGPGVALSTSATDVTLGLVVPVAVSLGGTGATTAASARTSLGAAASGANSDITSLLGLTTPLAISEGGTAAVTASAALTNLGGVTAAQAAAAAPVQSVFGRTGAVVAQSGDYTVAQVTGAAATGGTLAQFAATTSAQLAGVLTDETGSGAAVFGTSPTLTTPTIAQPVIQGVTNGTAAAAGQVGEVASASPAAITIANNVVTNVASITLAAGDWDIWGQILYSGGSGITFTQISAGFNQASAALPGYPVTTAVIGTSIGGTTAPLYAMQPVPRSMNFAATTTVYLVGLLVYSGASANAQGVIYARRQH